MKSCGQNIIASTICSIIGIIIISVILNIDLSRTSSADFMVTVISMLVTILIGWNIYTVIDFKNKIRNAQIDYEKIKKRISDVNQLAFDAIISTYYALYQLYMKNKETAGAITAAIQALEKMVEIDLAENNKSGNIERFSKYLSDAIDANTNVIFGVNNISIIEPNIKKIRENENYHYIKKQFEEIFKQIEARISSEKK